MLPYVTYVHHHHLLLLLLLLLYKLPYIVDNKRSYYPQGNPISHSLLFHYTNMGQDLQIFSSILAAATCLTVWNASSSAACRDTCQSRYTAIQLFFFSTAMLEAYLELGFRWGRLGCEWVSVHFLTGGLEYLRPPNMLKFLFLE